MKTKQKKVQRCKISCFSSKFKQAFQTLIFCHNTVLTKCQHNKKKIAVLNCNILKTAGRGQFKFDENVFQAYPSILVNSENLNLNACLIQN